MEEMGGTGVQQIMSEEQEGIEAEKEKISIHPTLPSFHPWTRLRGWESVV